jgi:NAD(P)-dependent dehydrogenase (short-subunit alcohol dehydrogenase family)
MSRAERTSGSRVQRVALVSGGNRGIGLEVVRRLAQEGFAVVLGTRDLARGRAAAKALAQESVEVRQLDVAEAASIERCIAQVADKRGRLDVLINNAGILYDTWQRASAPDFAQVRAALETNLLGAWQLAAACVPAMRKQRYGRIVNVSSGAGALGEMSGSTPPAYGVSKAALNALTLILAGELEHSGILVNAVCPGWVATDMGGNGGRPVEDGARGVVWAATLPDDGPTGGFFRDGKPIAW